MRSPSTTKPLCKDTRFFQNNTQKERKIQKFDKQKPNFICISLHRLRKCAVIFPVYRPDNVCTSAIRALPPLPDCVGSPYYNQYRQDTRACLYMKKAEEALRPLFRPHRTTKHVFFQSVLLRPVLAPSLHAPPS